MVGFAERFREEGRQEVAEKTVGFVERAREEGRQEGRQEGLREGEALLLHRVLRERFGELPDWVWSRLQQADIAQLERWSERILTADNLEALFGRE